MGAICPRGLSASISVDVNAPADILWLTIADLETMPDYISSCKYVHIPSTDTEQHRQSKQKTYDYLTDFKEGLVWKEVREMRGQDHILSKSITSIRKEIVTNPKDLENYSSMDMSSMPSSNVQRERIQLRIHSTHPKSCIRRNAGNTRTITIETIRQPDDGTGTPYSGSNPNVVQTCTMIGSTAVLPSNVAFQLFLLKLGMRSSVNHLIQTKIEKELVEIAREAERRFQVQQDQYNTQ